MCRFQAPVVFARFVSVTPAILFSRKTRIRFAVIGQNQLSELTGRPGKSDTGVKEPASQNGIERMKTRTKNFRGDPPLDEPASGEFATAEGVNRGTCSSSSTPSRSDRNLLDHAFDDLIVPTLAVRCRTGRLAAGDRWTRLVLRSCRIAKTSRCDGAAANGLTQPCTASTKPRTLRGCTTCPCAQVPRAGSQTLCVSGNTISTCLWATHH